MKTWIRSILATAFAASMFMGIAGCYHHHHDDWDHHDGDWHEHHDHDDHFEHHDDDRR